MTTSTAVAPPSAPSRPPAPQAGRGPRRALLWGALAAALLVAAAWLALRPTSVGALVVVQRDFVQTVVASGHVEAPHRVDVGAQVTGTVAAVPVSEGARVAAGALLVQLDDREARASWLQAQAALDQARLKLRQLAEVQRPVADQGLRQARAARDSAEATWRRQQSLYEQGFIGEAALDEARRARTAADAAWLAAQAQALTVAPGGSDLASAQAALVQAEAAEQAARARLAYTQVRAPVAGVLISRAVEVGSVVQAGKALMTLSPAGAPQLVLALDEKHLQRLRVGQPALASADAFPGERFVARLAYLNPGVNASTGAVTVKLDVPEPPAYLQQDMTVSVDIEVGRRPQALLLPTDALHPASGPTGPWVWQVVDGRVRRQPVRTGLSSPGWVELLDGLQAGDVVLPASATVHEGQRVRAQGAAAR